MVFFQSRKSLSAMGLIIILFVFFGIISCLSYNSADASFNVLTDEKIRNIFGIPGAYLSDILMQSIGFAVIPFFLILGFWGFCFVSGNGIFLFWLRMPIFCITLISFATLIEIIFHSKEFYYQNLPGGYIGYIFYTKYVTKTLLGKFLYSLLCILINIASIYICCIITNKNYKNVLRGLRDAIYLSYIFIFPFQYIIRHCKSILRYSEEKKNNSNNFLKTLFRLIKQIIKITFSKRARKAFNKRKNINQTRDSIIVSPQSNIIDNEDVIPNFNDEKIANPSDININQYVPPMLSLLQEPKVAKVNMIDKVGLSKNLTQTLLDFGVIGEISGVNTGPVVSLFEFRPKAGTKSSRVIGLSDDIARTMQTVSARIAVIQGKDAIGIELPNKTKATIYLRDLLESPEFIKSDANLPMVLGKDIAGNPIVVDMAKMPHLLIAGTTGSGKSVGINAMILSLIYKLPPSECRMIMIDPKMLELSVYDGIPHLMTPVITDSKKAIMALKWAVAEMENRYKIMSSLGVRNIINYNTKVEVAIKNGSKLSRQIDVGYNKDIGKMDTETIEFEPKKMPYIVLIVDEMADLMIVAGKEVEAQIQRLAQMARAAGIHIIMATQRPSVDVITGVIKANFPSRISFQVTSKIDSRTILGEQGAEQLLGQGDMLFMQGASKIQRVHGPFVADSEVEAIVKHLKDNNVCNYVDIINYEDESGASSGNVSSDFGGDYMPESAKDDDELYKMAIRIVKEDRRTSISYIQRKLRIGYNKAANLIEKMEEDGILSSADKTGKRIILTEE